MYPTSKQKKYTHSRMKACIIRNDQEDKENMCCPDDFKNKKFSVELPSKCMEVSQGHQKSIFNEQISVTLNTSNGRANIFDKDMLSVDIQTLNHILGRQRSCIPLQEILEDADAKSIEVKLMIERMLDCLKNQHRMSHSSMVSQKDEVETNCYSLSETLMKPYIEKEIDALEKNLDKLVQEKEEYVSMKNINSVNKTKILSGLQQMYMQQMQQLQNLQ